MTRRNLTSVDNPLRIAEVPFGECGGLIGITFAPGKYQTGAASGLHRRDLHADLDQITLWNAAAVVTLVEAHELDALRIPGLGKEIASRGMEWHHRPIKDYGIPDASFEAAWPTLSARLRSLLSNGSRVLIHCKGGLGRAGTVAARLLVESGIPPKQAICIVRGARPGAIESREQEHWITLGHTTPLPKPREKQYLGDQFAAPWMTADWTLRQRLAALADFRPIFEQVGFEFSELILPRRDGTLTTFGAFVPTSAASHFNDVVYGYGWVRRLDWTAWRATEQGTRLMRDPEAMSSASDDDLAHVITVCVRADRFCDGYLSEAYEEGLLKRIVLRAEELLRGLAVVFDSDLPRHRAVVRQWSDSGAAEAMDWFEKLTGFKETDYESTRSQLEVERDQLLSRVNGQSYVIGTLELKSLHELRRSVAAADPACSRLTFRNITGDVRALHQHDAFKGALFQVASQFNMLEMVGPSITPEQGVTRYHNDRTQGPACAIAAGAATIFRNYFARVEGQIGQTSSKQLDGLSELGTALATQLGRPVETLWAMRNGYALCSADGLKAIGTHLRNASEADRDDLRSKLRIGVHTDVEVTEGKRDRQPRLVSQVFCSALPVSYSSIDSSLWQPFAELVLEAAYEATLLAAAISSGRGGSKTVLLTQLGGGAFGNDERWIKHAISRALTIMKPYELDVQLVSYGSVPKSMIELEDKHQ